MDLVGAVSDFPLVRELARLTSRRASGALSVTGDPGGTVYLTGGGISYVDTAATPGVETLLVASGRVREVDWRAAHEAGVERGQVGQVLLERGLVGRAELEVDVLGALADAAVAVVFTPGPACRFEPEARHWLGAVVRVELGALVREVARRRTVLDRTRSRLASDREPVVPVRRLGRNRVAVTAAQWNVLMHADGKRSTRDLAWVLGRGVCAVTLEVHHLLERGLVEVAPVEVAPVEVAPPVVGAVPARRPDPAGANGPRAPEHSGHLLPRRLPARSWPAAAADEPVPATAPPDHVARLPAVVHESSSPVDLAVLQRLISVLEAL